MAGGQGSLRAWTGRMPGSLWAKPHSFGRPCPPLLRASPHFSLLLLFPLTEHCVFVAQSCPTLCDPPGLYAPGSSVHGILPARILEWVAVPFSRGSSPPRDRTPVSYDSCIAGGFFTV